jgi:four helix bundle protein
MATAKAPEDLDAWQLAVALRDQVFEFTAAPAARRFGSFCDQIQRSSSSVPANIAEGFRRYKPRDFARYLRIALGSLGETQTHLEHARTQKYISEEDFARAWRTSCRAIGACSRLRSYLSKCPDRP